MTAGCLTALLVLSPGANADLFEPISTSNLNPFVQLYGIPATRSALLTSEGALGWEIHSDFANNFTESVAGAEAISLDGETYRTTLTLRYGLTDRWEVNLAVPYIQHKGGTLDGFIENWHDVFGLPNGGRERVADDQLAYLYRHGSTLINFREPASGLGDVSLNLGYLLRETDSSALTLRGGVKFDTGDAEDLTGSGSTDFYTSLHYSDTDLIKHENWYFHSSLGVLVPGDGDLIDELTEDWVVFGSASLAWHTWRKVSLKAQLDFHSPLYDSELKELGEFSAQLVLGGSLKVTETLLLDVSVAEDIVTDTSPDVVLQIGLRTTL